ncbi:hypothetical protein Hanom_Chr01g00084751 [Helianthus anomalus]
MALIPMLHTKRENSTQNTSLVGERAHLVYKPHVSCLYNQYGTSLIRCNDINPKQYVIYQTRERNPKN